MKYRGPNNHPQTLGEFVRLDWSMRWGCSHCDLTNVAKLDVEAALDHYGEYYSTSQFMRDLRCRKCDRKIGLLTESPEDRAENARIFGVLTQQKWDSIMPSLP